LKILSVAWYIYDKQLPPTVSILNGGGIAIRDITEYVGRTEESWLFLGRGLMPAAQVGHIHIVDTERLCDPEQLCTYQETNDNSLRLRMLLACFSRALEDLCPDIVNFQGVGEFMLLCIDYCRAHGIPYLVTDHLFVGQEPPAGYESLALLENQLFHTPDLRAIAVSTGMKNKILQAYPQIPAANIVSIPNGSAAVAAPLRKDIRQLHALKGKRVLLCVGTLLERKNQKQIVRAFTNLPVALQAQLCVLFCGPDRLNGQLQQLIYELDCENAMICTGLIPEQDMGDYYAVADGLISASRAEGLSLAYLEALKHGKPVIMFADSECATDLTDPYAICFAKEPTDQSLSSAILEWSQTPWDARYISAYADQFRMETVAQKYIECYCRILGSTHK